MIPDEATRLASLAGGDVDAVQAGGVSNFVVDAADVDGVTVALGGGNRGNGVIFNTEEPPTDDLRVRQALAHAVDQEALLEVAAGEAAELSELRTQFFTEDSPFYSPAVADAWLGHDPDRARALVDDYVEDPDRSDGKAVGEPVSLTFNAFSLPTEVELAAAYARFYEDAGFEVTVEQLDQSAIIAALFDGSFHVQQSRGLGQNKSPLGEFEFHFGEGPTNFTRFHDDTVVDVIDSLRTAADLGAKHR